MPASRPNSRPTNALGVRGRRQRTLSDEKRNMWGGFSGCVYW